MSNLARHKSRAGNCFCFRFFVILVDSATAINLKYLISFVCFSCFSPSYFIFNLYSPCVFLSYVFRCRFPPIMALHLCSLSVPKPPEVRWFSGEGGVARRPPTRACVQCPVSSNSNSSDCKTIRVEFLIRDSPTNLNRWLSDCRPPVGISRAIRKILQECGELEELAELAEMSESGHLTEVLKSPQPQRLPKSLLSSFSVHGIESKAMLRPLASCSSVHLFICSWAIK